MTSLPRGDAAVPVIVGVGEVVQRSGQAVPLDPVALGVEAARRAADDCGIEAVLAEVDSLDVVNIVGWPYADAPGLLAESIGAAPRRRGHSDVGGHQPVALLDAAAARIARGESAVSLIAGGEAMRSLETAMRGGGMPPWPSPPPDAQPLDPRAHAVGAMAQLELHWPAEVYPLYEQGSRRAGGMTQAQALEDSSRRWAAASEVAAANPYAWTRSPHSAEQIATVSPDNRLIAWPYPKLLTAHLGVDQAAAVIITSTEVARRMGIVEDRWVYPWPGAGATEPHDVLKRSSFERTTAGAAALDRALSQSRLDPSELDLIELYSCFPCVPRMAAAHLGLHAGAPTTVTGGLTFFGGPANNYMLHAIAAMTRRIRSGHGELGLLYGQGGYATTHMASLLSARPTDGYAVNDVASAQQVVDAEPRPRFDAAYAGDGVLETFTMPFDRAGAPSRIVAVGRAEDGTRFAGEMVPDESAVAVLTSPAEEPLGRCIRAVATRGASRIELS